MTKFGWEIVKKNDQHYNLYQEYPNGFVMLRATMSDRSACEEIIRQIERGTFPHNK
jgi:hypothetical protein